MTDRRARVVQSHVIARRAFASAGIFAIIAVIWAGVVLVGGGSWWGPLHAFLAGTVLLAISGASQMFTITWSASPAPPRRLVSAQLWSVTVGVAVVLVAVTLDIPWLTWSGAALVAGGLIGLGASISRSVRHSLLRRFDLSARFYLTALASGTIGVLLGGLIGSGAAGESFPTMRLVHSHLNLIGLVGFTIIGTIPTFLPTVAHHRAVSGKEALVGWWLCVGSAALITSGLFAPTESVGVGALLAGVAAVIVLFGVVTRLWDKGRTKLSFLQISLGVCWLAALIAADGISLISGAQAGSFSRWTAAAVIAGVCQVLLGSLAYLIPVLLGLPSGRRWLRLTQRPALPLLAANLAGLALVLGAPTVAVAATTLWLADFVFRLGSISLARSRSD